MNIKHIQNLLIRIFWFVGYDIKNCRYFEIKTNSIHWHMYLWHSVTFFTFLLFAIFIQTDITLNDGVITSYFLLKSEITKELIGNIHQSNTRAIYLLVAPFSVAISFIGALFFLGMQKTWVYKDKELFYIKRNIFLTSIHLILGSIFPLIFFLGGGIIAFKIMSVLSSEQTWWLSCIQILITAKVCAIISSQLSANFIHFILHFRK